MLDYIIVGLGLSGISFSEQLLNNDKSFLVFENESQKSSIVAGGLYNPVILKRFTLAWNAHQQLEKALPFYKAIENRVGQKVNSKISVKRLFASIEEQNNWFTAADKSILCDYLSLNIENNINPNIHSNYGLGVVNHTGKIDTEKLINAYKSFLGNQLIHESFDYDKLVCNENDVVYKNVKAKKIIFCEGFGLKRNPYFKYLPLDGTKGELLIIKAPDLKINYVLKSSVFLIPLGNDLYSVGATYNFDDKSSKTTTEAKNELVEKLSKVITCDYEIINQKVGIRPTVVDRKPLIGLHPKHRNLAILNGLGTRGVVIAPTISEMLYNHIENDLELPSIVNIKRFDKLFKEIN